MEEQTKIWSSLPIALSICIYTYASHFNWFRLSAFSFTKAFGVWRLLIQLLIQSQFLRNLVLAARQGPFSKALLDLHNQMLRETVADPKILLTAISENLPHFCDRRQHDAHEFLTEILNHLQRENQDEPIEEYFERDYGTQTTREAVVDDLLNNNSKWYSQLLTCQKQVVECSSCGASSESRQPSFFVQIDVPNTKAKLCDLMSSSKTEVTSAMCGVCDGERQKTIRRSISYAADNILVHAKRFRKTNNRTSKNEAEVVPTPVYLQIKGRKIRYQVSSIVCHVGSLTSGHYTPRIKITGPASMTHLSPEKKRSLLMGISFFWEETHRIRLAWRRVKVRRR